MTEITSYLNSTFQSYEDIVEKLDDETSLAKSKAQDSQAKEDLRQRSEINDSINRFNQYIGGIRDNGLVVGTQANLESTIQSLLPRFPQNSAKLAEISSLNASSEQLNLFKSYLRIIIMFRDLNRKIEGRKHGKEGPKADSPASLASAYMEILPSKYILDQAQTTSKSANSLITLGLVEFKRCQERLKPIVQHCLTEFLGKTSWPTGPLISSEFDQFTVAFQSVLTAELASSSPPETSTLDAFEILTEPINLRFSYHFESDKDTNRLDKPEWAYNHIINIIDQHQDFLNTVVSVSLGTIPQYSDRNATHEFISALLNPVTRKAFSIFPQVSDSPKLLSHLVYETVRFDNIIKEKYLYLPYESESWSGVAGDLLGHENWFDQWLNVEKEGESLEGYCVNCVTLIILTSLVHTIQTDSGIPERLEDRL